MKWTSEFQNPLGHNIYLICKTFMNNLIVYPHQLISIVKFEILNDFKIMSSKARLKKTILGNLDMFVWTSGFHNLLAHTHFNMFVDEC